MAANLVAALSYVAVTVLFYFIFRPVSGRLSALAALLSLVGCAVGALGAFRLTSPVHPLVFFGFYCLSIGYLVYASTFLPRVLGVLMALGGLGWLTFVSPSLAGRLFPYNMFPGILGETILTLWLLVKGVDVAKWEAREGRRRIPWLTQTRHWPRSCPTSRSERANRWPSWPPSSRGAASPSTASW
jgi:hypothetical protein